MLLLRLLVGVLFCLTPVTAVIAVGWTMRAMRRVAVQRWHRRAQPKESFPDFARAHPETAALAAWPGWVLGVKGRDTGLARAFGGLWANLRTGVLALVNVWLLTLPVGLIWLGSWWAGWNNSYTKGYEQAFVAPAAALAGIALFALVMGYLPLAQARQAMTGRWTAFWNLRDVRALIARARLRLLLLALAYLALSIPVLGVRAFPQIAQGTVPGIEALPVSDLGQMANLFYIGATLFAFPAFVFLHFAAARIFAVAAASAVSRHTLPSPALSRAEWAILERLGLDGRGEPATSGALAAAASTAGRGILGLATAIAGWAAWIAFAALVYVAQFLNYQWFAWLSHPLIHLPWVRHIPI